MILTTTTQKLQVVLASAKATNDCPVTIDYIDFTSSATTPGVQAANTNGITATDILNAPSASTQRKVNLIQIPNIDTANVVVTVQINDNGTVYEVIKNITVWQNYILQYTDQGGWATITRGGGRRDLRTGWAQEFNANGTWYKPGNARFVLVEVVGGGGGGGGGAGGAAASIRAGGGGGGGGFRTRQIFLSSDLPSSVSVTVGAQTSAAAGGSSAAGSNGSAGNQSSFGNYLIGYAGGGGAGGGQTANTGGAGGGGGGATSAGTSATSSTAVAGGNAMIFSAANTTYDDSRGAGSGAGGGAQGKASYLGGGSGGGGSTTTSNSGQGGYSWFSGGGGGGGGAVDASNTGASGISGGITGSIIYGTGTSTIYSGGLGAEFNAEIKSGGPGIAPLGFCCGFGGGSGSGNPNGTGFAGGNGGFPGGGGGGGGGGLTTGGGGGTGAAGVVRVWGW